VQTAILILMKNAILVPGRPDKDEYYDPKYPTNSNNHWFPWLSKQLQINDIFAVAIEPPMPWQPRYEIWKKEFEKFDITPQTVLVGHSCGGGFLVRWLSL
jgi:predicted alpha/beta hydrolase family esterase